MRCSILLAFCLSAASCAATPDPQSSDAAWPVGVALPDVPLSLAPFDLVHANWKQRMGLAYIYLEHHGDDRKAGARISELLAAAADQGAPIQGAPFLLFYDDPAVTPMDQLVTRVCIALESDFSARAPLYLDELPTEPVVYAAVGGPFPKVRRAYPGLMAYLAKRGWLARPPIREIYLTSPVGTPPEELVTEVQIPWVPGG